MDDALLSGQQARSVLADAIASALTQGDSVLVTGAEDTTAVLAAVARVLVRSRTRVLQVRPPYDLPAFMHQLAPPTDDAQHAVTTAAFRSLTAVNPTCERIVLLVEDAHLMPEATLGYIEAALHAGPHLRVALAGRDELGVMLASPGLSGLRGRLSFHRIGSVWVPKPAAPAAALPAPRPVSPSQQDDRSRNIPLNQARPSPAPIPVPVGLVAPGVTMQAGTARPNLDRVRAKAVPEPDFAPRPQPTNSLAGSGSSRIPLRASSPGQGTNFPRVVPNAGTEAFAQATPMLVAETLAAPRTAMPAAGARPIAARPRAAAAPVDRVPAGNAPRSSAAGWIWGSVLGTVFLGMIVMKVLLPAREDHTPIPVPRAAAVQPDIDPGPAFVVPEPPAPALPSRGTSLQGFGSASQSVLPELSSPTDVAPPVAPLAVAPPAQSPPPAQLPAPLPASATPAPALAVPPPASPAGAPSRRDDLPRRAVIQADPLPPLPPLQPAPPRPAPRTRPVVTARTDPRTTRILEEGLNAIPYPFEQEPSPVAPVAPPERAAGDKGGYIGTFSTDANGVRTFHVIR